MGQASRPGHPVIEVAPTIWCNMHATSAVPGRNASAAARLGGDVRRAIVACGSVLLICVGFVVIASTFNGSSPASRPHVSNEGDLRTGSLLVVAPTGDLCRERTIDNSTWQIRNKGWVDCADALAKSANASAESRSSESRIAIIREGFLRK